MKKSLLLFSGLIFLLLSCEKDTEIQESSIVTKKGPETVTTPPVAFKKGSMAKLDSKEKVHTTFPQKFRPFSDLETSSTADCFPTEVTVLVENHTNELLSDPIAEGHFNFFKDLSFDLAVSDRSDQYFGADGKATKLVEKRIKDLERFWKMPGEIRVNGQHTATLEDRDILAQYYYPLIADDRTWDLAYERADYILDLHEQSEYLPESPLFAFDGFATTDKLIVIGDGLVQLISETGVDENIVWSGILAHEWAHQIQIKDLGPWIPAGDPDDSFPIRSLELEADFLAGYYLTHKRGATYNWKRVEEYLELFFQVGNCDTYNPLHHGTPQQRMHASYLGYQLAAQAQKKGHILASEQVQMEFRNSLSEILKK